MRKNLSKGLFFGAMLALASGCQQDGERIALADPTIFVADGKYYMTGTSGDDGFTLLESSNLRHWTYSKADPYILRKGEDTYGERDFWAPQIVELEDRYLMTYSAQGKMCVAESKELTGPYKQRENRPITDCPEMNIDTYLFKDEDGKWYMYHARYIQQEDMGGNAIFVAEFDMDTQKLKEETLTECLRVSEPWELTMDGMSHNHKTLEGPTVMKRDSIYYMFYSAN
ncbi:MAG: family 43 glycosylhydrolase, partial [Bacteroidaceae bacterium]|nr:family 43 glycosylhydrolase [Bacteroidaceae bacterium]